MSKEPTLQPRNAMPWIGDSMLFPRPEDEGFDGFVFSSDQVETLCEETRQETAQEKIAGVIRSIARLDLESDADFLKVVQAAASMAN